MKSNLLPRLTLPLALMALAALLAAPPARADDGHDHGAAPTASAGPALPRFSASSELFELVGVIDGTALTVYLDRFDDNSPVPGARLELDLGGTKVALEEHAPGEFEATLAAPPKPGLTAVTATVTAGAEIDLLAGELDLHDEHAHAEATPAPGWRVHAPWALGGLVLAGVGVVFARRAAATRRLALGGAA